MQAREMQAQALEVVLARLVLEKVEQYRIDGYQNLADAVWGFWCDTVRHVLRGQPLASAAPAPEALCRCGPDMCLLHPALKTCRMRDRSTQEPAGGASRHSVTDWIPTKGCDCDKYTAARELESPQTAEASPQADRARALEQALREARAHLAALGWSATGGTSLRDRIDAALAVDPEGDEVQRLGDAVRDGRATPAEAYAWLTHPHVCTSEMVRQAAEVLKPWGASPSLERVVFGASPKAETIAQRYHVEAFDEAGKRIGGFEVRGADMGVALAKAASHIEVKLRPSQPRITVTLLPATVSPGEAGAAHEATSRLTLPVERP